MESINGFSDLNLSHHVLQDLEHHGMEKPMPIQSQSIPILMQGRDLIAEAKTGTGKTLAFAIPIVEKVDNTQRRVQALVITPTRELAQQVTDEVMKIGYKKRVRVAAVYGGTSISAQARLLESGVQVVVGTPGRIMDMIDRRILRLDGIKMLVLDEADRMLDMGFIQDIRKIISCVPKERQTMLFSATMPEDIRRLAQTIMKNPESIAIKSEDMAVDEVEQFYHEVPQKQKFEAFTQILREENPQSAIIFCNTKRWATTMDHLMSKRGFQCRSLHGDLSQNQRDRVMQDFKSKRFKFLIATDVAARGLDIDDVTHIFNYDLPKDPNYYIHRIGRTARAGKKGRAISLICSKEIHDLWNIEHKCRTKIHAIKRN